MAADRPAPIDARRIFAAAGRGHGGRRLIVAFADNPRVPLRPSGTRAPAFGSLTPRAAPAGDPQRRAALPVKKRLERRYTEAASRCEP